MMPEYFFHVSLELFAHAHIPSPGQGAPPDLSHAFKILKPFLRSPRSQGTRFPKHNLQKQSLTLDSHIPFADLATSIAEQVRPSPPSDHRLDSIRLECIGMDQPPGNTERGNGITHEPKERDIGKGLGTSISGAQTKGRYTALSNDEACEEWGIVHLYRDASETASLYRDNPSHGLNADIRGFGNGVPVPKSRPLTPLPPARDEDCTTLCILAIPSYLTPSDFLAFVGEKTRDQVSHFRMVRTSRQNRYMVLMKFRNGKQAREWQSDWNGRVFNSMEPETVHVVFLKSVEIMPAHASSVGNSSSTLTETMSSGTSTFPSITNDPFITIPIAPTAKPPAPRTPSLVELPTCPVCLERMDETTGLLTILCQHVFHCICLEKWSGGGCPVCRYTHDDFLTKVARGGSKHKLKSKTSTSGYVDEYEVSDEPLECEVCHADASLWQCLICGKVGCGRYENKHAYQHFEETGHTFSMDLESKRVWDYAGDVFVHRIIQDAAKPGEKLVELPGRQRESTALEDPNEDIEVAKMENIAVEYTHLLTSQLESQRVYFEEMLERAVDKASEANKSSERDKQECEELQTRLQTLGHEQEELLNRLPKLESEISRLEKRATKFEDMAKSINIRYLEEKSVTGSLMERIQHLENVKQKELEKKIQQLEETNDTNLLLMEGLREEHRDAMMQISAQEKLNEMVANGELEAEDLVSATIQAGPAALKKRGKQSVRRDVPSPSTDKSESQTEEDAAQAFWAKLGIQRGQAWTDEKATELFNEFKSKALEQGLLDDQTADEGGGVDESKASKKKKKGKGRR